jgi:hypothetical protein
MTLLFVCLWPPPPTPETQGSQGLNKHVPMATNTHPTAIVGRGVLYTVRVVSYPQYILQEK